MNRQTLAIGLAASFLLVAVSRETRAQEAFTSESLYRAGVEAYFRGCSPEAESHFSTLMSVDPNDPRPFYFRALSLMRQGRSDEAYSDMEIGAEIEARAPNRFDIGKTLERIQGPTRLTLERYRNRAHLAAGSNPPVGASRAPDTAVLRERRVVPLDEFARPGAPQSIIAPAAPSNALPALPPAAKKPAENTPAEPPTNPFGDDPSTSPKPQSKTPPAKAAAPPAKAPLPPAPKPAAPAPKAEDDSPF